MKTNDKTESKTTLRQTVNDVCASSCQRILAQLERAKATIASEFRGQLQEHAHQLDLAINEAEALAWETGFPQLFFPTLALEKARAVAAWHERQQSLLRQSSPQSAVAA